MFKPSDISSIAAEAPVAEIAAAKAAGKCGNCYACCAGHHEQCKGPDFDWHTELGVDEGIEQARVMGENMAKYGTIDKPAEKFCLSIYLIASDGSHDVFINSEQEAENLVRILDMNLIDYIELYRVHDVPVDTCPYEYLRHMKVSQ